MPRPTVSERARLYIARMPGAVSGSNGHNATFSVACALVKGFNLSVDEARPLMEEYNQRCDPPWRPNDLEYKLNSADRSGDDQARGYLLDGNEDAVGAPSPSSQAPAYTPPPKAEYDASKLTKFAGDWANTADLLWLANRSVYDPALVNSERYLRALYKATEKVLVFTNDKTQGEAVWPGDSLPQSGKCGVWYMCQPVDGEYHPNPRVKPNADGTMKMSRRSEESVTDWRHMVIESDEAPVRPWLGALVQLPLRIAAIYTSGGRSVHALIRVDAVTKSSWDDEKHAMKAGLLTLGADPGCLSAVRLTRLPGTLREGKMIEEPAPDGAKVKRYVRFAEPAPQKLLYLNPEAPLRPLIDMLPKRSVEKDWLTHAAAGPADTDETGGAWIRRGLSYYANVSPRLREALAAMGRAVEA